MQWVPHASLLRVGVLVFFYAEGPETVLRAGKLRLSFISGEEGLPRFWQPRFYDFNVYSAKKKREKLEYRHANPVTRKLVQHPKDWPWSSFSFCAKGEPGLLAIDPVD